MDTKTYPDHTRHSFELVIDNKVACVSIDKRWADKPSVWAKMIERLIQEAMINGSLPEKQISVSSL